MFLQYKRNDPDIGSKYCQFLTCIGTNVGFMVLELWWQFFPGSKTIDIMTLNSRIFFVSNIDHVDYKSILRPLLT